MPHISEDEFAEHYVKPRLEAQHGPDNVEREKYLRKTGGYCDFWVEAGDVILAIEVENDAGAIRPGAGQAIEYAWNHPDAVAVVYVPEDHDAKANVQSVRDRGIPVIEVPTE